MKPDTRKVIRMRGSFDRRSASKASKPEGRGSSPPSAAGAEGSRPRWTFLSNHAHVLTCLARNPDARLLDVAGSIGITERAVQNILADLVNEGLVKRYRKGRRNTYELSLDRPLRHPIEKHRRVGDLVSLILG